MVKRIHFFYAALLLTGMNQAQNPVSPPGVCIADPTARVWSDGRLYLYGSLDESCNYYCSYRYHVLSTEDMKTWNLHKDVFASRGAGDEVGYNESLLFAPSAAFKNGIYYLYYCQPDKSHAEGVATSDNPSGPFREGRAIDVAGYNQIDPCVFVDDDGEAYYLWGQFTLKMARMNPDMLSLDKETLRDSILTESGHHFHEGAFLTKREGIYYLVFTDISRGDIPTCIGYATASAPFGPYTYRGVIIDNNHCNPNNWNNHGSIALFNGQWYVFYHRSTHGCKTMRKACVEPIFFETDGSIREVEMTSQGASGPLSAFSTTEAEWACILHGNARMEMAGENGEILAKIHHGDKAGYKYLDFGDGCDSLQIRFKGGKKGGKILVSLDKPWRQRLATIEAAPDDQTEWRTETFSVPEVMGIHPVWFHFYGDDGELFSMDWFVFK